VSWVSPTGFVDGGGVWTDEVNAYDEDTVTWAFALSQKDAWNDYLELTHAALDCDKIQIWADRSSVVIKSIEIDVYYSGAWNNIFSDTPDWGQWQEHLIGSMQSVTAMRVRFYATAGGRAARVMEADFNEVMAADYYHGLKVQGEGELALCDVGTHPLRFRKGGTTYGIELVAVDDPNASNVRIKTGVGTKAIRKYT